jgi:outer membrane protein assembly factor BamB
VANADPHSSMAMGEAVCEYCGHRNSVDRAFCLECLAPLRTAAPYEPKGWIVGRGRLAPSKKRRNSILLAMAVVLSLWGLGVSGVIFNGPVPLPSTTTEAVVAADSWALPGRDVAHTSAVPDHSFVPGRIAWQFEAGTTLRAEPSISGDRVFLATGEGKLVALGKGTGELLWERDLPLLTGASPVVTGSTAYLTLRDGQVIAFNVETGDTEWAFQAPDAFFAPAVIHKGVVYAASWGGIVYALDAIDGRKLWTFETEGRIIAAPSFADNLMAVAIDDRLVYIVDIIDAGKRLIYDAGHIIVESPVFAGDRLLVSTGKGRFIAIDQSKVEYSFERMARYWRQQFFIWRMQEQLPVPKGHIWGRTLVRDSELSAPAVADGVAYVASANGQLHAMSIADGEILWSYDAGVPIHTSPTVSGSHVFVGTDDGDILGLNIADGILVWQMRVSAPLQGAIIMTEDALYATSREPGVLFAVH